MSALGSELIARTRRLDADVDLLEVAGSGGVLFSRSRVGFAGRGSARVVGRGEVMAALGSIAVDDEVQHPGTGPVAFGALPFLPDGPADMVVPEVLVGRDQDGTRWVTTVSRVTEPETDPREIGRASCRERV